MSINELESTIKDIVIPGRGILAADESTPTIGKRFKTIDVESTEETRCTYRGLLFSTPNISDYVSGVILFEETLGQKDDQGSPFPELLAKQGIVPGIKVDKGLAPLAHFSDEKITQGLDGLSSRLETYKQQGARFAKWREVFSISANTPSQFGIEANAEVLARYAAQCQAVGIVPIVEPELLMDGDHDLARCEQVTTNILHSVFNALFRHRVILELMILKPNMVISGQSASNKSSADQIAQSTINVLRRTVPAAVPSINFLSGGQGPEEATVNLNAINKIVGANPWQLSFSYGRALQEPCLKTWLGNAENINAAQDTLFKRAKLNSAASLGEYSADME